MKPFFSIIIPTYNRSIALSYAINSSLKQNFEDWELIIVDDGSSDNTKDVVSSFKDKRIKYIYQENKERSFARNTGILNSSGKFICFLDSDDEFLENHLSVLFDYISKNSLKECVLRTFAIEQYLQKSMPQSIVPLVSHPVNYLFKSLVYPSTLCIHSGILKKQKFDTQLFLAEDTDLLVRIFSEYPLYVIENHTVVIHKGEDNTQSQLNGDKHLIYFKNLNRAFSYSSISSLVDNTLKNDLLSRRLSWAIRAYSVEKKKTKGLKQYLLNFRILIKGLGFNRTLKLFYSLL